MRYPVPPIDLDRSAGVDLHRQIAAQLRFRIASGDLRSREPLPSLRAAADAWGVNLHTVRRAYEILEAEGLLVTAERMRARVSSEARTLLAAMGGFETFVRNVRATAEHQFGASLEDLIDGLRLLAVDPAPPDHPVWVVECSASLAAGLADQVRSRWHVDARPWALDRVAEIPPGQVVGTFYHMRELRDAARSAGRDIYFVQVRVDAGPIDQLRTMLSERIPRLVLYGVDCESALAIGSEVREAVGGSIEIDLEVGDDPAGVLSATDTDVPVLFSPQSWDRLEDAARADPRSFRYRTLIPTDELEALGPALGWPEP